MFTSKTGRPSRDSSMRRILSFSFKAALSVTLLYFALAGIDPTALGERLQSLKFGWMLVTMVLAFMQLFLLAARWRKIAGACGAQLPLGRAFQLSLIAAFFNQVLPSTVGGDGMRIWLFARDGTGWAKATYSVLLDRFVGVLALAIMIIACLPWTLVLIKDPIGRATLLVIGAGSIGGAAVFLALGYLRWGWLQRWSAVRHLMQISQTARQFLFSIGIGVPVLAFSLVIHALTAAIASCAALAVDASFGFVQAIQLIPPVMLIATLPISVAGWGVREKSLVVAFAYAGLSTTDGLLVSVLLGVTILAVGIVGGIVWLIAPDRSNGDRAMPNAD